MKILHIAASVALGFFVPGALSAASLCPAIGFATDCNIVLTIGPGGTLTSSAGASSSSTYDGSDDVLVGLVNNSGTAISSVNLSAPGIDIFGFDGDGIDTFGSVEMASNPDTTGYGGPDAYFTNISPDDSMGTVNFISPLSGNGGFDYFSLEEAITYNQIGGNSGPPAGVTPEPSTLLMLGTGLAGLAGGLRRRLLKA
jgi:hypothetical protein